MEVEGKSFEVFVLDLWVVGCPMRWELREVFVLVEFLQQLEHLQVSELKEFPMRLE